MMDDGGLREAIARRQKLFATDSPTEKNVLKALEGSKDAAKAWSRLHSTCSNVALTSGLALVLVLRAALLTDMQSELGALKNAIVRRHKNLSNYAAELLQFFEFQVQLIEGNRQRSVPFNASDQALMAIGHVREILDLLKTIEMDALGQLSSLPSRKTRSKRNTKIVVFQHALTTWLNRVVGMPIHSFAEDIGAVLYPEESPADKQSVSRFRGRDRDEKDLIGIEAEEFTRHSERGNPLANVGSEKHDAQPGNLSRQKAITNAAKRAFGLLYNLNETSEERDAASRRVQRYRPVPVKRPNPR